MADSVIVQTPGEEGDTHYYVMPDGLPSKLQNVGQETIGYIGCGSGSIPIVKLGANPGDLDDTMRWGLNEPFPVGKFSIDSLGAANAYTMHPSTGSLEQKNDIIESITPEEIEAAHAEILRRTPASEPPVPEECRVSERAPAAAPQFG